jgi:DNA replication protein DnaC
MTTHDDAGDVPEVDPVAFRVDQAATVLAARVPARFATAAADHPHVVRWVAGFLSDPAGAPSLVLKGPTGSGKTHQAWGTIRHIVTTMAKAGCGLRWRFVTHPELNDELRPKPDGSHAYALERYLAAEQLVLDDLGAGKQSDWTGDSLHRLVDHRWAHHLTTIYSTNLGRTQLAETVGDRVMSRLADATHVTVTGPDRRWEGNR